MHNRREFLKSIGLGALFASTAGNASVMELSSKIIPYNFGRINGLPVKEFIFREGKAVGGIMFRSEAEDETILVPTFRMTQGGRVLSRRCEVPVGDALTENPQKEHVERQIRESISMYNDYFLKYVYLVRDERKGEIGIVGICNDGFVPVYSSI